MTKLRWQGMSALPPDATIIYVRDAGGWEGTVERWSHWALPEPVWWSWRKGKVQPLAWYSPAGSYPGSTPE